MEMFDAFPFLYQCTSYILSIVAFIIKNLYLKHKKGNLNPDPVPCTLTLKNLEPKKTWLMKNVGNSLMQQKKIGRPQSIIYYNTKILLEETCKQAIWKNS